MPGSPPVVVVTPASVPVSLFDPLGAVPVSGSCGQNTAFATFETNVLLLRRAPLSSAASEPSAMVRRRHKLGALENISSACVDVPWRVRNRGIGELLANVNCSYWSQRWYSITKRCYERTGIAIASCAYSLLAQRCCDDSSVKGSTHRALHAHFTCTEERPCDLDGIINLPAFRVRVWAKDRPAFSIRSRAQSRRRFRHSARDERKVR
jgi:hypothetical protein